MTFKKTQITAFSAKVNLGLERGYTQIPINKRSVIDFIQAYQRNLIKTKNIYLSVSVYDCTLILNNQEEPHLTLNFINYPKFPLDHSILKSEVKLLTKALMTEFEQNRVVIEYLDETVMLEVSDEVDPRISTS